MIIIGSDPLYAQISALEKEQDKNYLMSFMNELKLSC